MSDIDGSPVSQFASRTKKPGYMGPGLQIQNQEREREQDTASAVLRGWPTVQTLPTRDGDAI
jgi:hypothetical protein